ncbi:MAG TPA: ATP-binding protein, partial [Terriglobia bacterium]|nr:ATP-binding protein [Terriglobia bacterium]
MSAANASATASSHQRLTGRIRIQPRSVRVRLTLWYAGVMLLVLGVYAAVVYTVVRNNASQRLDERLRDDFDAALDMVAMAPDGSIPPYDETGEGDSPWLQVYAGKGQLVYNTPEARRHPVPSSDALAKVADERIVTIPSVNPPYRVMSGGARMGGRPVVVQVARSEASVDQDQRQLLYILLLGMPVAVALAGIGGYGLARRALAPVDRMVERARSINAEQLNARLPIDNPDDELGRLATVFNETFARLESSFERMRRFTADASHELRTPLTAIRSVGEVGLRVRRDEGAYREIIGSMLEEVDRLALLVDRLLTLSRADTGQAKLSMDVVDLCGLAEEVAEQLGVLAEEKEQAIEVHFDPVARWIGDRVVLRQALLNLVDNAIKYTPMGGRIDVRVAQTSDGTIIEVSDTGPGIPHELQSRVFDRFYRVDRARSRENGGTGLGLAIAKWAVEVNGGQLTLEPSNGTGSCFRIRLPQTVAGPVGVALAASQ